MWFIGLEFQQMPGGLNLTLTYEIQIFINSGENEFTTDFRILQVATCESLCEQHVILLSHYPYCNWIVF